MDKYQYMVVTVSAIFCILLLIGFGILVNFTFKEEQMTKKIANCPDYWKEVKDVRVVNVNPNKDFIYKDNKAFTGTKQIIIGNNSVQNVRIMLDKNTPIIRINNEVTKKITACKVPSNDDINAGKIYSLGKVISLRNYTYGSEYKNLRNNYTIPTKIDIGGSSLDVKYDNIGKFYKLENPNESLITGDDLDKKSTISTPGFYWKAECINNTTECLSGKDEGNVKIWGVTYNNNKYSPSEFYIDFKDDDWHAYNMHKSKKCNLKNWANANGILWDGITNAKC